jgi:hypothetical protein
MLRPGLLSYGLAGAFVLMHVGAGVAGAQVLIANDDRFGVPFGEPLVVEAFGVLDNDTLDGEAAGENGATAELVVDASHGTLALASDGSFTYSPGTTFDGTDEFVYRAVFGPVSDEATVVLTACNAGPDVFDCWSESAFLAKAAEFGYARFEEGFEDDIAWGNARYPNTAPSVSSQGIEWRSNHPDPPASNEITTGPGPARTGLWGFFDPEHGYATGTPSECDVDVPPPHCLFHDGFTGTRDPEGGVLHGVGGYLTGIFGANVAIALDGGAPIGGGKITSGHQFFGVIDTRPAGFTQFEFRELDGKVGQALFIFGDDFTLLTPPPTSVEELHLAEAIVFFAGAGPNPSPGNTTLRFSLPTGAVAELTIYDVKGRLVCELARGIRGDGAHVVPWDGRDREGKDVANGVYFGRLVSKLGATQDVRMRKIVVAR